MSRFVSVSIDQGQVPNPQSRGGIVTVPAFTATLELGTDRRWHIAHGSHSVTNARYVLGYTGQGYYTESKSLGWFTLYDETWKNEVLVLRGAEKFNGPAFAWPEGNRYLLQGSWRPASETVPNVWLGFMGKASAGAFAGAEVGIGGVFSTTTGNGVIFHVVSQRAGLMAGFSGGLAFVMATGFKKPGDFQNYTSSGGDWALSIGAKISGGIKAAPLLAQFRRLEGGLDGVDAVMKRLKDHDLVRELHTIGKNICGAALVDTEYQSISAFDIPLMGAGAEAGIFWSWSRFNTMASY